MGLEILDNCWRPIDTAKVISCSYDTGHMVRRILISIVGLTVIFRYKI